MDDKSKDSYKREKFLIVAGLPKSGTTFLYSQFAVQPEHFSIPTEKKEIDFFRSKDSYAEYLAHFSAPDGRVHVDASPLYMDNVRTNFDRLVECLRGNEIRVVVCLRNPFERLYSHYLHDISQNFEIFGSAPFSVYDPTVLSRYIYPILPRVKYIKRIIGADNVIGFSFESTNNSFTDAVRDFANLPPDWSLDFDHNPTPGFTSPTVYFHPTEETTVRLNGKLFRVPAQTLVVANRQHSIVRTNVHPVVGERLAYNQSYINRSFDTGQFPEEVRKRVIDDFLESCAELRMENSQSFHPQVYNSQVSVELPESQLAKLDRADDLGEVIEQIYAEELRSTDCAVLEAPGASNSLAKMMAELNRVSQGESKTLDSELDWVARIVAKHGQIPLYLTILIRDLVRKENFAKIESLFAGAAKADRLMKPIDISPGKDGINVQLSPSEVSLLENLGIRIRQ